MTILGIDPGTHRIGYGVIQKEHSSLTYIEAGLLPIEDGIPRLSGIEKSLEALLVRFSPARAGIERLFFTRNQKTGIGVAQARGVLLNALEKRRIPVVELSPSEIKLAVTGTGTADKRAVARMVSRFLSLPGKPLPDDATDALAIAIAAAAGRIDI